MLNVVRTILVLIGLGLMSGNAAAGLITFNGSEVKALDLNDPELNWGGKTPSFINFYNYDDSEDSGDTGLEETNTIIMFLAELDGEYAVFTIANKHNGGGTGGRLVSRISGSSGEVVFRDDLEDFVVEDGIAYKFVFSGDKTDGFIFKIDEPAKFTFNQVITAPNEVDQAAGLAGGVKVISFDDGTFASKKYSDSVAAFGTFSFVRAVNAPSTMLLLSLFSIVLLVRSKNSRPM